VASGSRHARFWAKGYEGAALSDLTRANAHQSAKSLRCLRQQGALFRKVSIDMRMATCLFWQSAGGSEGAGCYRANLLGLPTWRVIRGFQQDASWSRVRWLAEIRAGLFRRNRRAPRGQRNCVRRRLQASKAGRGSTAKRRSSELARYVMTVLQGMAVQEPTAPPGFSYRRVAQLALRACRSVSQTTHISIELRALMGSTYPAFLVGVAPCG